MDEQAELVDIELKAAEPDSTKSRLFVMLSGGALVAALLAGAYVATSDEATEVAVATEPADESEEAQDEDAPKSEPTVADDVSVESSPSTTVVHAGDEEMAVDMVADSAYYGGGEGSIIFDGSRYIGIGYGPSGQTLRTSVDGIEWDERAFPGLPQNSNVYRLAEHEGTVVAVVEQWEAFEESEDAADHFFGPPEGPKQFLASSTDLESWTLTELPATSDDEGPVYRSITGLALGDSGVALLTMTEPHGLDEMRILFDAGILDEDALENYCGLNFSDSEAIIVQKCNHQEDESFWMEFEEAMSAAETDEERQAIEQEFEENYVEVEPEIIATIEPGDAIYEQLSSIYEGPGEMPDNSVLTGPIAGPWVEKTLPVSGYASSLVEVDGVFVAVVQQWQETPDGGPALVVVRSTNGSDWDVADSIPGAGHGLLAVAGSNLVLVGGDELGQPQSFVSSNGGESWAAGTLSTELYGAYPQAVHGPAGIAVVMRGSTEPYPDFGGPEVITVTKDGYTLTMTYSSDGGTVRLAGPDGADIYSLTQEQMYGEPSEEIVRIGRLSGSQTFLDPETGDDLVTFTNSDFERAYEEIMPTEPEEEIAQGLEILFSNDGQSWRELTDPRLDIDLRQGDVQVVAVGDDEVIVAVSTWNEPPAELFAFEREGRAPSATEEAALNEWFEVNHGGHTSEFFTIPVG